MKTVSENYDTMLSSGSLTLRNYLAFRYLRNASSAVWLRTVKGLDPQGISLAEARVIKQSVSIPVLSTGGYQSAPVIRAAITDGSCDAVAIARPLIANPDLPRMFAAGIDNAPKPCSYCNKCLMNVVENPLGCYDEDRFESREAMMEDVMSFYAESGFTPKP